MYARKRQKVNQAIRDFFTDAGYDEVETPILQYSPGAEVHLHGFKTHLLDRTAHDWVELYLQTSPEFAMKKLIADGMTRIFQISKVFRNGDVSPIHSPEFTMLEWYHTDMNYFDLINDCMGIIRCAAGAMDYSLMEYNGHICNPYFDPDIITVQTAFEKYAGLDVFDDDLAGAAKATGMHVSDSDSWEDIFHRIMLEKVEPNLGVTRPTFLLDYPIELAALARPKPSNPKLAERIELYICGMEVANGFGELTDGAEQARRLEADMKKKSELYGDAFPIDEEFIAAVYKMPDCAGMALGLDRLLMLLTGAQDIGQVLWQKVHGTSGMGGQTAQTESRSDPSLRSG